MTLAEKRRWLQNESGMYMSGCDIITYNQFWFFIHSFDKTVNKIFIFCDYQTSQHKYTHFNPLKELSVDYKLRLQYIVDDDILSLHKNIIRALWFSPTKNILDSVSLFEYILIDKK